MRLMLDAVTKQFPSGRAVDDVSLTLGPGVVGLLGPNGAGKTTLMRIITGILRPTAGRVEVGSHDLSSRAGRAAIKRTLGYLPQELALYPDLTGWEMLDYIGLLKGIDDKRARHAQIEDLLERVGMAAHAKRRIRTYSGGLKRRIGIAQVLLGDPRLIIVDEPTAGLDPEERMRFRALLGSLGTDRIVILSTHILEDVAQSCPRVAVLHHGRIVYHGPTGGLTDRAAGQTFVLPSGVAPGDDVSVINASSAIGGVEYRVVGPRQPAAGRPVDPTLEDGYVALLQSARNHDHREDPQIHAI